MVWLLLAVFSTSAGAKTIYVDDDGPADFDNIQAAIDDANNEDTIIVEKGVYFENINFKSKNIILRSTDPNNHDVVVKTIIDGQHKGPVVTLNDVESPDCVLDGFTITNGNAHGPWPNVSQRGGGICCRSESVISRPTIINCMISNNSGDYGGGVFGEGNPTITNCTFSGNVAWFGGGILLSGDYPKLSKCTFIWNSAGAGGGVYGASGSPLTLTDCTFKGNSAGEGGGIYQDTGIPTFNKCVFYGNSAGEGGGMYVWESLPTMTNCIFSKNTAERRGGGFCGGSSDISLVNCTFNGNSANEGGGIYNDGSFGLTNCILWDDIPNEIGEFGEYYTHVVTYSNIQGGWPGEGNINQDPCFADPINNDYHLKSHAGSWDANSASWVKDDVTSLCIDAGDPASPIGYEPFPNGGIINMGAYGGTEEASKSYFGEPVCETIVAGDINGDCAVNFKDFAIMASHWLDEH